MRLRLKPDGLEERLGWHVARVGDEGDGHPRAYRLVCGMDLARLSASSVGEDESACYGEQEGEAEYQDALRFSHTSI